MKAKSSRHRVEEGIRGSPKNRTEQVVHFLEPGKDLHIKDITQEAYKYFDIDRKQVLSTLMQGAKGPGAFFERIKPAHYRLTPLGKELQKLVELPPMRELPPEPEPEPPKSIEEALEEEYFSITGKNRSSKRVQDSAKRFRNLFLTGVWATAESEAPKGSTSGVVRRKRRRILSWISTHKRNASELARLVQGEREFMYPELMKDAKPHPELAEKMTVPVKKQAVERWDLGAKYDDAIFAVCRERECTPQFQDPRFTASDTSRHLLLAMLVRDAREEVESWENPPKAYEKDKLGYLRKIVENWVKNKHKG
ncbi:MAG: hypothetical protein KAW41_05620 [Candidatus Diapherotrites archaeon]|nr:hypothetical protein [Candidatus Diapherotrites archaeon]